MSPLRTKEGGGEERKENADKEAGEKKGTKEKLQAGPSIRLRKARTSYTG